MDRLELIDDIRNYALNLMKKDPNLDYAEATKQAKLEIIGYDIKITDYNEEKVKVENEIIEDISYKDLAFKELGDMIKTDLYSDLQLKEIVIAKRMGVNVESFINIFFTPEQIRFITFIAIAKQDITPYTTNLTFDPKEEMKKIEGASGDSDPLEDGKQYTLTAA